MRGQNTNLTDGENSSQVQINLPFRYRVRKSPLLNSVDSHTEVILLLHGYTQSAGFILPKFEQALPGDATLVAANGPFLIPDHRPEGIHLGFSWYFYDAGKDDYYIDMKPAVEMWKKIVDEMGIAENPKCVVGYSQGGYLAPFVAQELKNVKQVVGVSCEFLHEEILKNPSFRMDAVHGDQDSVVDYKNAKNSHQKLLERGVPGAFVTIKKNGHKISPEILEAVKNLILKARA